MALLGVGIFPQTVISKVTVNSTEQGKSLDITFKKAGAVASDSDSLDFLSSTEVGSSDAGKENNVRLYGVNLSDFNGNTKSGDDLLNEVLSRQAQLNHILNAYLTKDAIKWDLTKGLGVKSKSELVQKITSESTLNKMVENLFTQFEAMLSPVIGEDSKHVVVKFLRKSKASNFPRLADRKLDWNPFIAAEDDKALVAKIKFSDWEKQQGFDSNAQSLDSADASPDDLAAQTEAVNNVFG